MLLEFRIVGEGTGKLGKARENKTLVQG